MKEDHLVCCECTEVSLKSVQGKVFALQQHRHDSPELCFEFINLWGYNKSKTTKTHIQQASKTFAMWECSVLRDLGRGEQAQKEKKIKDDKL